MILCGCVSAGVFLLNQDGNRLQVELNTSAGYNTVFRFGDITLAYMRLNPRYVLLNSTYISMKPQNPANKVSVFVYEIGYNKKVINATCSGAVNWVVGGINASQGILVNENGAYSFSTASNSSGYVNFTNTPNGQYEIIVGTTTTTTIPSVTTSTTTTTTIPSATTTTITVGGPHVHHPEFIFDLYIRDEQYNIDNVYFNVKLSNRGDRDGDIKMEYIIFRGNETLAHKTEQLYANATDDCALLTCPHPVVMSRDRICSSPARLNVTVYDVLNGWKYAEASTDVCVKKERILLPILEADVGYLLADFLDRINVFISRELVEGVEVTYVLMLFLLFLLLLALYASRNKTSIRWMWWAAAILLVLAELFLLYVKSR